MASASGAKQYHIVCVFAIPNPTTSTCSLSRQGAKHGAHATKVSRHGCASKLAPDRSCSVRHHERRRNEPTNPILAQTPSKTRMLLQDQVCCNDDDEAEPYYLTKTVRAITKTQIRTRTTWMASSVVQHIRYGDGSTPTCAAYRSTSLSNLIIITERKHTSIMHRAQLRSCLPEPYFIQMCARRSTSFNGEAMFNCVRASELAHIR